MIIWMDQELAFGENGGRGELVPAAPEVGGTGSAASGEESRYI